MIFRYRRIAYSLLLFLLINSSAFAQLDGLQVNYEVNRDNEYEFYASNTSGDYKHVIIKFIELGGLSTSAKLPFQKSVRPGRTRLFTLKPFGTSQPSMNYQVYSFDGVANPKIEEVEYVFPIVDGDPREVFKLTSQLKDDMRGVSTNEGIPILGIKAVLGDTIRAARRGRVIKVIENKQLDRPGNLSYASSSNEMIVRHLDGTMARYRVFQNNSSMVSVEDEVLPGDPIALVGGEEYSIGPHTRLIIEYLEVEIDKSNNSRDWTTVKRYVPNFRTANQGLVRMRSGQSYQGLMNPVLRSQEMTKREKKKYLKSLAK